MPVVQSDYQPAWYCKGGHAQTLWAPFFRRAVPLALRRERLELSDGDFLDLDWFGEGPGRPIVVLLHGLQGSSRSPYICGMMSALQRAGFASIAMHFRGCSEEHNRLPRAYHSGDTADLTHVVLQTKAKHGDVPLLAVGFSLGANVLLKWLGETGPANPLTAAVAVSPPFELGPCCDHIARGFSRVYESHFLASLKAMVHRKARTGILSPQTAAATRGLRRLRDFDHHVTAPLHGFESADDYYRRSSCRQYLQGIAKPTLIVHAHNDPFMPAHAVPGAAELSVATTLELCESGGHIGFVTGKSPFKPRYWLEERVPDFLRSALAV